MLVPMIDCETETPNQFAQVIRIGSHTLRTDLVKEDGGEDLGPGPHDLFDAALVACKTLTANWFARKHGYPLERVEAHVARDTSREREGTYVLKVKLAFHGPLSDDQKRRLFAAVGKCPIHKLMTTVDVQIETAPLEGLVG